MNDPKTIKNSKKNFAEDVAIIADLRDACRGLQFISETDADIEPFIAGKPSGNDLAAYAQALALPRADIEEVTFRKFFGRLTAEREWFGEREKKRAARFAELQNVLEANLTSLRVIRAGKIRIEIYIAGIANSGRLAGVKTTAIET